MPNPLMIEPLPALPIQLAAYHQARAEMATLDAIPVTGFRREVYEYLRANPGSTTEQIAAALGDRRERAQWTVSGLIKVGWAYAKGPRNRVRYYFPVLSRFVSDEYMPQEEDDDDDVL